MVASIVGTPPTQFLDLARQVFELDARGRAAPHELATAIERTFERIYVEMSTVIGQGGFAAVVERALYDTTADCPWLDAETMVAGLRPAPSRLAAILERESRELVLDCVIRCVGAVLALLSDFIGESLTIRLIHRAWAQTPLET
ncbi:MAG: hypothetical protein JWO36_7171 [Myxococcales bacterium]|nr:hypothetical protein [Myxococcales bacterium]